MVQPHATSATPVEPATRIDFASRRQPRGTSSGNDDNFAAVLDRSNAQRLDALRQLRSGNEAIAEEATAQTPDTLVDSAARARKPELTEQKTQSARPQRRTTRSGNEDGASEESAATVPTPGTKAQTVAQDTTSSTEAQTAPVADTTIQPPTDTQTAAVIALAIQAMPGPPAPIQGQAPGAQPVIGGPAQPGFATPQPPAPGTFPALPIAPMVPIGPEAPAEPMAQGAPLAQPLVPASPAAPVVPQAPAADAATLMPTDEPSAPPRPQTVMAAPVALPMQSDVAPKSDAAAKPHKPRDEAALQPSGPTPSIPAQTPVVPPPAVGGASALIEANLTRGEAAPAAMLAAALLVEAGQPQRMPGTKPELPPATPGILDDGTMELPALATGTRAPIVDDAGAAARGAAPTRNPGGTNNAVAAQLAQFEDGGAPRAALPAAPAPASIPFEAVTFGDDHVEAKLAAAQDEVAPVRHTIVLPPETGPTRIESTAEAVAARAGRMPMHPAVTQVAVSVTKAVQEGVDRITIKLQPPELGRIDVRLEVGVDGRIQAVFAAERPATVEILQRDVRELERALQSAGLSTDSGSLSFGLKQNGGQNGNAFAAFDRNPGSGQAAVAEDETVLATTRSKRAAADGRLDIQV